MDGYISRQHGYRRLTAGRVLSALEVRVRRILGLRVVHPLCAGEITWSYAGETASLEPKSLLGAVSPLPLPEQTADFYPRERRIRRKSKNFRVSARTRGSDGLGALRITAERVAAELPPPNVMTKVLRFLRLERRQPPSIAPPKLTLSARRESTTKNSRYKVEVRAQEYKVSFLRVPGDYAQAEMRAPVGWGTVSGFARVKSEKKPGSAWPPMQGEVAVRKEENPLGCTIRICSEDSVSAKGEVGHFSVRVGKFEKAVSVGPVEICREDGRLSVALESKYGYTEISKNSISHSFALHDTLKFDVEVAEKVALRTRLEREDGDLTFDFGDCVAVAISKENPGFRLLARVTAPRTGSRMEEGEGESWSAGVRFGWFF